MGGKPKTSTPKDMRLKANNPNAGKPRAKPAISPPKGMKKLTKPDETRKGVETDGRNRPPVGWIGIPLQRH